MLRIHFSTRSAPQASTSAAAPGAGSNEEQAEPKAVPPKSQGGCPLPTPAAPVTSLCFVILGGWRKQEQQHSHRAAGSRLTRKLQQMNWLLVQASVSPALSLVKHAEKVTSSATRPTEPFLRSLSNFLSSFNKRRQAHRQNNFSHTSGNFSSRKTY